MGLDGKGALVMAPQDIQSYAGDQIDLGIDADGLGAFALVVIGDDAVEGMLGGRLGGDRDMQLEIEGQGQADYIEAGANVCGGAGGFDDEGGHDGEREEGRERRE